MSNWGPNPFADGRAARILDFDIENRPLSYWVPDMPTADITSIASMWIVGGVVQHDSLQVSLLGEVSTRDMLAAFVERYNEADMVTGHYISRHDLPIINGALYDEDMPLLGAKRYHDTKTHMFKKGDIPATQEFLLELLDPQCNVGTTLVKYHMSQRMWREANRLTEAGLALTKTRVLNDVHAHAHMRQAMLDRGWLRPPSVWKPGGADILAGRTATGESK